jgi:eukaryotic-like serine/threonine-protein kinase
MNSCPARDRLERLLDSGLVDTELDAIEQHVEGCADCQHTLDELTSRTVWGPEPRLEDWVSVDPPHVTVGETASGDERQARRLPTVAGYEIICELGRGGMGVVYKAHHIRLNRPCALKMILAGAHAGREDAARFVTEAEAIARIQHPCIVQIHHIGDADGLPFLELEFISGGNLDQQLDGTPWPATRAARLAEQLALGIAEAHRLGIIHRDLKPSNVLLAIDSTPKVGDFGLAKMLDGNTALTRSESVMGSPSYMAPEQAQGRAKEAGPAVDVYSLGAILYELLAGRPPFRGTTALETLEQVKTSDPVAPSRLVPGIPRDLETICLKSLQKEPGKRYESAQALAEDLRRFLDERPIVARRISGVEHGWRWCLRNRVVAGTTVIAASAIAILTIGAIMAAFTFRAQRDQIRGADRKTRESLFESEVSQAQARRFSRRMGQRFESLAAVGRAAGIARELKLPPERFETLRDEAIASLALPDMRKVGRVIDRPPGVLMVVFDPSMSRYALRFRNGTIQVKNVADDQGIASFRARGDRDIFTFGFSPDGRFLSTAHRPDCGLTVWDVEKDTVALDEKGPFLPLTSAKFSPDSRAIAVARQGGDVLIHDLKTRRPSRLRTGLDNVHDMAFRPDGTQIAVINRVSQRPSYRILEVKTGRVIGTAPVSSWGLLAWSPDGATLALASEDSKIYLFDAATGTRKLAIEGSGNSGLRTTFHPAGNLLASNGWEHQLRLWDAIRGQPVLSFPATNHAGLEFSPDGRVVVATPDRLTVYQVEPALEYRSLVHDSTEPMGLHGPSIHPDNRLLAVGSTKGVILWDLARGTECGFPKIGDTWHVMFEATGDLITSGKTIGMWRWPVRLDDRGEFCIGPPSQVPFPRNNGGISEDRSGRILAQANRSRTHVQISGRLSEISPLDDCRYVAVSPEGDWLATGSHHVGAQVWRVRDQVKMADLPIDYGTRVVFSPDGKWLMTQNAPCRLWTTGTWVLARELGGAGLCFSQDSRMVAVLDAGRLIHLVEPESGRVIARLESPGSANVREAAFTPDGSRLVLTSDDDPAVRVWDLRAVRRGLATMELDWVAPPYSTEIPPALPLPPLQIDFGAKECEIERYTESPQTLFERYTARLESNPNDAEAYHHRGHALIDLRRDQEAVDDLIVAHRRRPDDAHLRETLAIPCNNQAWKLVTGPASTRDPERGLSLALRAVELAPKEFIYLNTLGVAEFRAGRYAHATSTLERSLAAGRGETDAFDLFFLAMAHHRLGHREQARDCFDRAVHWLGQQKRLSAQYAKELIVFRAEAEAILAGPAGELPVDVFAPTR